MQAERGRDTFKKYKRIMLLLSRIAGCLPLKIRKRLFDILRNKKGKSGIAIRYILLKSIAKYVGDNVSIREGVYMYNIENIEIGDNVSIHPMCYIEAAGGISIGNNVSIAHLVTIMSCTHIFNDKDIPIKDQDIRCEKTIIEDNVWIGAKATILYGVTVSEGSIVGANSLVNKNVPPFIVVGGIPAKQIKERD